MAAAPANTRKRAAASHRVACDRARDTSVNVTRTRTSSTAATHAERVVATTRKQAIMAAAAPHAAAPGVARSPFQSLAAASPRGSVATTYCAAMFLFTKVDAGG